MNPTETAKDPKDTKKKENLTAEGKRSAADEKKLRDFLAVMAPKKENKKLWINDDLTANDNETAEPAAKKRKVTKAPQVVISHVPAKKFTGGKWLLSWC